MEDLINRVKNILLTPKSEWLTIEEENYPHAKVFTSYILLLALIPAVACFIGYGLIGVHGYTSFTIALKMAVIQFVTMVVSTYVAAFVINFLARNFGATENFDHAYSLVAYAYTPALVAGVLYIIPALKDLVSLASLYSLYLLYVGLTPMMKTPQEKQTSYFIVSLLVMALAIILLSFLFTVLLIGSAYRMF